MRVGDAVGGHQRILRVGGQLVQQRLVFLACLLDRAAILMAEYHQKAHAEHVHRVFQRGDHSIVYDLPCRAHGEQIADTGIENNIRAYPRVGAAQYGRFRCVCVHKCLACFSATIRMFRFALRKPAITCQHAAPNAACRAFDLVLVYKQFVCH